MGLSNTTRKRSEKTQSETHRTAKPGAVQYFGPKTSNSSHVLLPTTHRNIGVFQQHFKEYLDRVYGHAQADELESVVKTRQKIAFPREDLIAMLVKHCKKNGSTTTRVHLKLIGAYQIAGMWVD